MSDLLSAAIFEAERFLRTAKECQRNSTEFITGCKYRAATKRSSMDLSRTLTDLRKADISQWKE